MADTLAHIRRVARYVRSQERKALKRKMDGYNRLAATGRRSAPDNENVETLADLTADLVDAMSQHTYTRDTRVRAQHGTTADELAARVVSDEVRAAWHAKIGMYNVMNDDVKAKLRNTRNGIDPAKLRETSLNELAARLVQQWLDGDGYDPDIHRDAFKKPIPRECEARVSVF